MSVLVTVEFPCKPEKFDEFLDAFRGEDGLSVTRDFEGCELVETYIDRENSIVFLVEKWAAVENQQAYMNHRIATGFAEAMNEFMAHAPTFRTFEETDV